MRYAVPVYGGRLSAHFGQSSEFMLIEVDDKGSVVSKETIGVTPHNCGGNPKILASKGVEVVLAGGMGMGPRVAFDRQGIDVVLGVAEEDPEKAALGHFNETLVSGQNICRHGDSPCDHSGSHHGHN